MVGMVYLPNMNGRFLNGKCVGYTPLTPENGWLEDYTFILGYSLFSGASG